LKNIYTLGILFFVTTSIIIAEDLNDINIKSDKVELDIDNNKINFLNNVFIDSKHISISASSAIYDDKTQVVTMYGSPSKITSNKDNGVFYGLADKVLFFNNDRIHLIGNATMEYDGISISSNLIIFNPITGKVSSE
tara:strand:- start:87 stop:497 length:411 start_codon:yes stop_codon:yes gene_type:complete